MRKAAIVLVCVALGITACGGKTVALGSTGASGATGEGGSDGVIDDRVQEKSDKLDVLLVVDNSLGMDDPQALFRRSVGELIRRLINPRCVDAQGNVTIPQPAGPGAECDAGSTRESVPVRDMNIGVITTSIGGHGADSCSPEEGATWNPTKSDQAHLLESVRPGLGVRFPKWDPESTANPPGSASVDELVTQVEAQITAANAIGCGFEAPLEAAYRFLADPEPPGAVLRDPSGRNPNLAIIQGVDEVVLEQRATFLRQDSAVLIVILSNENDCSIIDGGINWLPAQANFPGSSQDFRLPRATSACASDPNSTCCRSCGLDESAGPPAGCGPLTLDPSCDLGPYERLDDSLSLRCWNQRQRFGVDFLYPIERYFEGFANPTVTDRRGNVVANPLFAGGRQPSLVTLAAIVGVPWQDVARAPGAERLEFLSWRELRDLARWPVIAGNPSRLVPPTDPYMREEVDPRSGTNPITGDPIAPPDAPGLPSPINGRDAFAPERFDLQTACITALPEPRECRGLNPPPSGCQCAEPDSGAWCKGTLQTHFKAYPGIRELELMRRLGSRAVTASICSRNVTDESRQDFGYRPAVDAMIERMKLVLR